MISSPFPRRTPGETQRRRALADAAGVHLDSPTTAEHAQVIFGAHHAGSAGRCAAGCPPPWPCREAMESADQYIDREEAAS